MLTSTPCTDLLTALLAARLAFPPIVRTCQGFSKRTGKKYGYADLCAIVDATAPVLGQHGLLLVQAIEDGEGGTLRVASTLFHVASGQWLSSEFSVEKPADMQEFGAASTYCKRYAQVALLNLSTEEDDDAASTGSSTPEKSAAAEKVRPSVSVNGNGHTPTPPAPEGLEDAALAYPTLAHLEALKSLACTACGDPVDVFEDRIRTMAKLPKHASVSFRLLVKTLPMSVYMTLFAYYRRLEAQLAKSTKEAPDGTASQESAAPAAPPAPIEDTPAVPSKAGADASGSAPEVSPAPVDTVETLVAYALSLGLEEQVTRRVITLHKDLVKCRRILTEAAERNARKVA